MTFPIRALVATTGLDGHGGGRHNGAGTLLKAVTWVVNTDLKQTPETMANAALHNDRAAVAKSVRQAA